MLELHTTISIDN